MPHTILAYTLATGGSVTDQDMSAATDPEFSQRNSHYIFTEQYALAAQYMSGANLTRGNVQVPTWNAIGRHNVWPLALSATIQSPPRMMWLRDYEPLIPMAEEYTVKATDSASEQVTYFMLMKPMDWNANLPPARLIIPVRATATITIVANAWSALGAITLEQSLRGGVYSVLSAQCQGTNVQAFRLVMPRQKMYHGRKLRPGFIAQQAIGDLPELQWYDRPFILGEWGRFWTQELPQLEIYGTTNGSTSLELRLWLAFLGESVSILDQWAGSAGQVGSYGGMPV